MLRRDGYSGGITIISADDATPYDRPNLSKDFLAGTASEEWIPLRSMDFYREHQIELLLNTRVAAIDPRNKSVQLADGSDRKFDALLLATGAEPVKLTIPGAGSRTFTTSAPSPIAAPLLRARLRPSASCWRRELHRDRGRGGAPITENSRSTSSRRTRVLWSESSVRSWGLFARCTKSTGSSSTLGRPSTRLTARGRARTERASSRARRAGVGVRPRPPSRRQLGSRWTAGSW